MGRTLCINKDGRTIPVFSTGEQAWNAALYGSTTGKIGDIYPNELFVDTGEGYHPEGGDARIGFYSPSGWRYGYVKAKIYSWSNFFKPAYSGGYSYGWTSVGYDAAQGYRFNVRRKCRIFSGTTEIDNLYAGDFIITDGSSDGGYSYPYRLSIVGYQKASGASSGRRVTDGWCDTDIEIGYSMYNEVTTYGKW